MQRTSRSENLLRMQAGLRELKAAAEADRNQLLSFLIEMAYVEASDQLRELHKNSLAGDGVRQRANTMLHGHSRPH